MLLTGLILCLCLHLTLCFNSDEINDLPGLGRPTSRQYSGYLDAGNGRHLFYWFVESERDPSNDPVILWLNGGPGCSSLLGNLAELGPFKVNKNDTKTLLMNDYRWNLRNNIIFLESPAGVGFSYKDDGNLTTNDDEVAQGNLQALYSFFEKFPKLKSNPFFVTGESYAGIYVPTLVRDIVMAKESNPSKAINIKGYGIGNGYMDKNLDVDSLPVYVYSHALIGYDYWMKLVNDCCQDTPRGRYMGCAFSEQRKYPACEASLKEAIRTPLFEYLNPYNIYKPCEHLEESGRSLTNEMQFLMRVKGLPFDDTKKEVICDGYPELEEYLSRPEVRKALHVHPSISKWMSCSNEVGRNYKSTYISTKKEVQFLAMKGLKGLVYNGDIDSVCNILSNEWFVEGLGFKTTVNDSFWMSGNQAAGRIKYFDNLIFTTIRGAGHMVPEDKPQEALTMLDNFLEWAMK